MAANSPGKRLHDFPLARCCSELGRTSKAPDWCPDWYRTTGLVTADSSSLSAPVCTGGHSRKWRIVRTASELVRLSGLVPDCSWTVRASQTGPGLAPDWSRTGEALLAGSGLLPDWSRTGDALPDSALPESLTVSECRTGHRTGTGLPDWCWTWTGFLTRIMASLDTWAASRTGAGLPDWLPDW